MLAASLHVEVVHAKKSGRIFHFELRPAVQVGPRELARKPQRVPLLHGRIRPVVDADRSHSPEDRRL